MFFVFFKIGFVTFGGGMAMLPILERELAQKRGWTTFEDLMDYYAIAQITPGIIAVNVATFLGYKRLGVFGGIITTLGVVFPSLIVISIVAAFLSSIEHIPEVQHALIGMNVAVAAMLTKILWTFIKTTIKTWKNIFGIALALLAFVAVAIFKIDSSILILIGALSGLSLMEFKCYQKNVTREGRKNESLGIVLDFLLCGTFYYRWWAGCDYAHATNLFFKKPYNA